MSKSNAKNTVSAKSAKVSTVSVDSVAKSAIEVQKKADRKIAHKAAIQSAKLDKNVAVWASIINSAIVDLAESADRTHPQFTTLQCRAVADMVRRGIVRNLRAAKVAKVRGAKKSARWADLTNTEIKFGTAVKAVRKFNGIETEVSGLFIEKAHGAAAQRQGRATIMVVGDVTGAMKVRLPKDYMGSAVIETPEA